MSTSNAIKLGVEAFNKEQRESVEAQAAVDVRVIAAERAQIKAYEVGIKAAQDEARKIVDDVYTVESVYGGPLPAGNPHAEVMASAIKKLNDARQALVVDAAKSLDYRVQNARGAIKGCEARIKAEQEKASKLVTETLTVEQVMA